MTDEWLIENDLEEIGHVVIDVISLHLNGGTEDNYKKPQFWERVSGWDLKLVALPVCHGL